MTVNDNNNSWHKQPRHQGPLLDTYKSFNCNRTFNDAWARMLAHKFCASVNYDI